MKQPAEFFADQELDLVYMARKLREALRLEEILTASDIDYAVEADTYEGGLLFRRQLTGAYFYVHPADLDRARQVLQSNGYKPYDARRMR